MSLVEQTTLCPAPVGNTTRRRCRVFTLVDRYLPAYKSGGPVRTIANMVDLMSEHIEFMIFCRDRDSGDSRPFTGAKVDEWNSVRSASVFYSSNPCRFSQLRHEILQTKPDVVYLNGFFAPIYFRYLILRRFGLVPKTRVVLAPRGEFSPGALGFKSLKKRAFLFLFLHGLRFYEDLIWQASSPLEQQEISRVIGSKRHYQVAPDLPQHVAADAISKPIKPEKQTGELRMVFISRLVPKKNLNFIFPLLAEIRGRVVFDIYGPPEDHEYAAKCERAAARCPSNIHIEFKGPVRSEEVLGILANYHLFILPTLGENFGHVILEGLLSGSVVLISDQTPWRGLEATGAGWSLSLAAFRSWSTTLQQCVDWGSEEFKQHSASALEYGRNFAVNPPIEENLRLFTDLGACNQRT